MPTTPRYYPPWHPGAAYHIYNRAVSLNRLFAVERDVTKFRRCLKERMTAFLEIYALACVGTHFHLHARVREREAIENHLCGLRRGSLLQRQRRYLAGELTFNQLLGDAFGRTFHAYANSFNKRHGRQGALFNQTVRRLRTRDDLLSRRLVAYIHCNEVKHGVGDRVMGLGSRTTFEELAGGGGHLCDARAVLERFGGRGAFVEYHRAYKARRLKALRRFGEGRFFGYEAGAAAAKHVWAL